MNNKLYYWTENLDNYSSNNQRDYDEVIEIKRLNFFIGKNNAGKSRFLRSIFSSKNNSHIYQIDYFRRLLFISKELKNNSKYDSFKKSKFYTDFFDQLNSFLTIINSSTHNNSSDHFKYCLDYLNSMNLLNEFGFEQHPSILKSEFNDQYEKSLNSKIDHEKFYIPILRGMRPVTDFENKQPYIERAQKDYFNDSKRFNSRNIITGECLYHELRIHLLGEPEQRDLIRKYEEKLSQYFFDNDPVSLIPKHDQDMVNIKIGKDKQFPISQLGDGLQQALILTYEAYIKRRSTESNNQIFSFFIEEPELHMHAGMIRQLMNFYLNETNHYYFFTTHSNHLLDMADESDEVIIQKIIKEPKTENLSEFDFKIFRCDRDRDLLASLGVKPSSVYLANCTIWVEGITDRLYITKYMEKYLEELSNKNKKTEDQVKSDLKYYSKLRRFMQNYHYTFVEYAGSNLVHWDFSDEFTNHLNDKGMNAMLTTSSVLLIADGDIQSKSNRVEQLTQTLGKQFLLLECKETENTLPTNLINLACRIKFVGLSDALTSNTPLKLRLDSLLSIEGMQNTTKEGFDINLLTDDVNYFHKKNGIGKIIDAKINISNLRTPDDKPKKCFADASGTIKEKLKFCRLILTLMDHVDWQLTESARDLCEKVFNHIENSNKPQS
ncbi:AAA family ATPase [Acinetobacter dispersus]|uniref:AAA family ATPase n=1 Tax=Acinetobacter dispersus TaxID=70348 RepID=UPI001F4B0B63|nr:AAA family ATPase [Acinetobacter dispersus]MCH7382853.1 AAA family ATPase [Acinetobacter dispersus]